MQRSTRNRIVRRPLWVASWLVGSALVWIPIWGTSAETVPTETVPTETVPTETVSTETVAEQAIGEVASEVPTEGVAGSGETAEDTEFAPASIGLRAYIDPETGEFTSTPTAEQLEVFTKSSAPSLEFSSEGLETFPLQRGGRGVRIEGRFRSALKVRRNADGSMEMICEDPDHAEAAPGGAVDASTDSHEHPTPSQTPSPAHTQWAVQ